jgi:carboxylesterase
MGAAVAAYLAATRPEKVAGLVAMANAIWLPLAFPTLPIRLLSSGPLARLDLYAPKVGADITDPAARRVHMSYGANPVRAANQLLLLGAAVRAELSRVLCPTLVLHGARDIVCPPKNAARLASAIGTRDVEVRMLARSAHILTVDVDKAEAAAAIERFVVKHARAAEAKAAS